MPDTPQSKITLYELTTRPEHGKVFSPFVWATKFDLALLGVDVRSEYFTFHQIRTDLARETGNEEVTVPTIKLPSGEYVTESWKVAEWLEANHPSPSASLFPGGPAGKAFAKFIDMWIRTVFVYKIAPMTDPPVMQELDPLSLEYYKSTRFSNAEAAEERMRSIDPAASTSPDHIVELIKDTQDRLRALERYLQYQVEAGNGCWILGEPSHADAVVFGWYAYTRVNRVACEELWVSEKMPLVGRWLKGVLELVGEDGLP